MSVNSVPSSIAIEGPPGAGKSTLCNALFSELELQGPTAIVPEQLMHAYNCAEQDQLHIAHARAKEALVRELKRENIRSISDRCRISAIMYRITIAGHTLDEQRYRSVETKLFGDCEPQFDELHLLLTDVETCLSSRRQLSSTESQVDLDADFFLLLHTNYTLLGKLCPSIYPSVSLILHSRSDDEHSVDCKYCSITEQP